MRFPQPGNPSKWSQEPLPVSEEGTGLRSQEIKDGLGATEHPMEMQTAIIDAQMAEISKLKGSKERYAKAYRTAKERITELEHEIEERSRAYQEALEKQNRHIRAMEDQLRRTKELSVAESARAKSILSPPGRASEAEVFGIVRDLNENVFQVAANLTEEWEKFSSSRTDRFTITEEDIDTFSQSCGPALVHHALNRKPAAVTFLVQSRLCELAAQITSNWRHNQELKILRSVYQLLSPSEGPEISARWRSLTQRHLAEQSSHSVSITRHVADILRITGSFPSTRHSFDFVKEKAFNGIETIDRLVLRLESIFVADIISSDMCLLFETPCTVFNNVGMTKEIEFDFDETFTPGREDVVVGTTGVGVGKSVDGGRGEGRRTEVMLKARVVLETDLADL